MTLKRIIRVGHKLAAQLGGVFVVNERMLRDYQSRTPSTDEESGR